jgi:hypothetical protein
MNLLMLLLAVGDNLPGVALSDEGGPAKVVRHINCSGAGITCTTSSTFGTITVPGGGGSADRPAYIDGGTCSAGQYVSAVDLHGGPTCSAVSYSQLSGSPTAGGSSPQVQYNNSGVLGGMSNATSDGTRFNITTETSVPSAPGSNALHFNYAPAAGFPPESETIDSVFAMPLPVGLQTGPALKMQGSTGTWLCQCHFVDAWASTNITSVGSGTATSFAVNGNSSASANWDAGNLYGRLRKTTQGTAATLNSQAGARYGAFTSFLGNAPGAGGFTSTSRFSLALWPGSHFFCGFWNTLSNVTATVESSSLTDSFYIGADGTDSNLHACSNDTSGSATCSDLGANFPKATGFYEVRLAAQPNGAGLAWRVERFDTPATASGTINSDMPVNNAPLSWQCTVTQTDGGATVKMDFIDECQCANW